MVIYGEAIKFLNSEISNTIMKNNKQFIDNVLTYDNILNYISYLSNELNK